MPPYEGNIHSEKLGSHYEFHSGIAEKYIDQLINYTNDLNDVGVQNNTTDRLKASGEPGRFSSREEYDKWLGKGREIYTLIDPATDRLKGILWLGREEIPTKGNTFVPGFDESKYGITYAIRNYGDARGAGVATEFSKKAIKLFKQTETYLGADKKGIWLEVNATNAPGINTYTKLGYRQVSEHTANGRLIMVLPEE